MKGIVCDEVEAFRYTEDLPEPELTEGHAIVSIRRIGICGTDYHAFKGNQPFFHYPRILGHELAGVIDQISANDEGLAPGDQVAIIPYIHCGSCLSCRRGKTNCCANMQVLGVHRDGGMRERISVPVTHLLRTEGLSLDEAAMIEPLAIGAHAVRRADVEAGDTVLVIGSGPIGLGVMAFAKYAGARVIAMDMNEERLAFCRTWANVDETVAVLEGDVKQRLAELTNGEFPIAVFDATGNAASMSQSFELAAHGGKLVFVGLVKGDIAFSDPEFHKRELTLMGSRNATGADFQHVVNVLREDIFDMNQYITHRAAFNEMIDSFGTWLNPASKVIKAVVEL
ncbi:2-desacetyl-2-hydroxyethyl bacteriochlorophyllide A dehydrogenase [Paenibacillus phyllosphaerae]|uniref:2-desacetyl-2-hydroxyethyl bacteriochlorophyllide A dehydrogenase n=1 Tax=Paenibacillus phyllosphaerae TaxID=274593 RepID=A0A7W5AYW5_9BACL|nr:zinc-binding alcohol dehydrogenase family protein [Paenibacillus phyllosphaerae]MBB3111307.1 2-desacetyl-2-hydroxyethyl bacteriochlorophyllide A dehydrogenase [Paenibacillus phyllosphaerae]